MNFRMICWSCMLLFCACNTAPTVQDAPVKEKKKSTYKNKEKKDKRLPSRMLKDAGDANNLDKQSGKLKSFDPDLARVRNNQSADGIWKTLMDVTFEANFDVATGSFMIDPEFTNVIRDMDGEEIEVEGYMVPVQYNETAFMLSAFPFSSCFFCGGAGPESVIEVTPKQPIELKEGVVKLKGILRLNELDPFHMPYLLEDARMN